MRKAAVIICSLLSLFAARAQQTQQFIDVEAGYRKGLELFDEKNFLSARQRFEEVYKTQKDPAWHGNTVLMQNVEFYIAACAVEAMDKDAEQLLLNYQKHYHETDKRRLIYFYLGRYYYNNKKYQEAIDYFTRVKADDLDNNQLYDYKFQFGYSYFTKKKFTEAKPYFAAIKDIKERYFYPANYYYAFISFYNKDYNEALKSFTDIEDSKMYSTVIPYYVAQIYFIKKDYGKLVPYLDKNLQRSEVLYKDEIRFLLGQVYFQKSEYAKALPLLEAYINKTQKVPKENIYQLAYCQYQTGAYNKAIENFKQLNLLNEKLGQNATYALGDCYLKTNQKDKARSAFQSASVMEFDSTIQQNALYNYAKLSFEQGYSSDAIKSFESYLEKYPNGTYADDVNELLATALVQTKDYDRAYKMMERMKLNSAMIKEAYQKVTYFRAVELFNDHKEDEALALCEKSGNYPINLEVHALATYLQGEIYYNRAQYTQAAEQYKAFKELSTPALERKGGASRLRAMYNLAYCYFKQKNYSDAVIYFGSAAEESKETIDLKGKNALQADLYMRLADCAFVGKNYNKAINAYNEIVSNQWTGADYAQYQKGIIQGLQNKNAEKIETMNALIARFPTSNYTEQAYFEIGETHLNGENYSAARLAYQNVINKFSGSALVPRAYMKIALIDYNSGKKDMAINDYKNVVQQFPKSSYEKEALAALKDIYLELSRADEYFDFLKNTAGVTVSASEQDSLLYESAVNAFNTEGCGKAIPQYANYISKFPSGLFVNEVHWQKSECHLKTKDFAPALEDLTALVNSRYYKYYEKALVKASGIAYYELKQYSKALDFYKQLYVTATSQTNTYSALLGMFRSAVMLKSNEETIEYADQLINSGVAKETDIQDAYYEKGKAYYALHNLAFSLGAFNRVVEYPVSEKCVESKYMVAKILFEQNNYQASLDTCFKLKTKYASYEYWVVKSFILMADNYYAQGNSFQAKATLESIVGNYEGDAAVLAEAREKLEKIRTEELNKTKIMQALPGDSLIMESDSIINNK